MYVRSGNLTVFNTLLSELSRLTFPATLVKQLAAMPLSNVESMLIPRAALQLANAATVTTSPQDVPNLTGVNLHVNPMAT